MAKYPVCSIKKKEKTKPMASLQCTWPVEQRSPPFPAGSDLFQIFVYWSSVWLLLSNNKCIQFLLLFFSPSTSFVLTLTGYMRKKQYRSRVSIIEE